MTKDQLRRDQHGRIILDATERTQRLLLAVQKREDYSQRLVTLNQQIAEYRKGLNLPPEEETPAVPSSWWDKLKGWVNG